MDDEGMAHYEEYFDGGPDPSGGVDASSDLVDAARRIIAIWDDDSFMLDIADAMEVLRSCLPPAPKETR